MRKTGATLRKKHTTDNKPMENFMGKAMSANSNGSILFFDEAEFEESLSRIMEQHDVKKRFGQIISLARQCEEHSFEDRAVSLYRHVLLEGGISEYMKNPKSDIGLLAQKAYKSLLGLSLTKDECVWEECSQLIGDVRDIFEPAQEKMADQ